MVTVEKITMTATPMMLKSTVQTLLVKIETNVATNPKINVNAKFDRKIDNISEKVSFVLTSA
ncbi:hypothetical protein Barb6_03687 [Bacteroidales bacterium Barb6]|nr:hypothetical protein Barb6_03687 [Bacteroidales bacterium Barb6]